MLSEIQSRIIRKKAINPDYIEHRVTQLEALSGKVVTRFWYSDASTKHAMNTEKNLLKKHKDSN